MSVGEAPEERAAAELRRAARALLRRPLLLAREREEEFRLVRRHTERLREWFDRNTGWSLHVDAESARLRKTPGTLTDASHPARRTFGTTPFTRRQYVLLCLALATLERGESQVALGRLAEEVVLEAGDPALAAVGLHFTMEDREERRDLVVVVRLLIELGVLRLVAGDADEYVAGTGDVLYDVDRRVLAGLTASRVGASRVAAEGFEERLVALTAESALDSDDLRFRAIRRRLTRRLLDDPVLYYADLDETELTYLTRQRAFLTARITELTGLVAEVRAEGLAMVDPDDDLTDVRMPEQGTQGHLTLLLAEHLAARLSVTEPPVTVAELEERTRQLAVEHAGFWAQTARAAGAEIELVEHALGRLTALGLVTRTPEGVLPRPALARYAVTEPVVRKTTQQTQQAPQPPVQEQI